MSAPVKSAKAALLLGAETGYVLLACVSLKAMAYTLVVQGSSPLSGEEAWANVNVTYR